jgi:hypothetical protein
MRPKNSRQDRTPCHALIPAEARSSTARSPPRRASTNEPARSRQAPPRGGCSLGTRKHKAGRHRRSATSGPGGPSTSTQLRPTRRRPAHADPSGGGCPPPPAAEHNSPLISLVRTIPNGRVPFGDSTSLAAPPLVGGGVAKRASGQWIIRSGKPASECWSETRLTPGAGRSRWRAEPPACLAQSPSYLNETSTRTRYVVTLPSSIVTSKR